MNYTNKDQINNELCTLQKVIKTVFINNYR